MKTLSFRSVAIWIAVLGMDAGAAVPVYRPADPEHVVLRLDPRDVELNAKALPHQRKSADAIVEHIESLIAAGARTGDERYYGYAEQALDGATIDLQAQLNVARAQILQHRHEFAAAEAALTRALEIHPRDSEALLQRAQIRIHLLAPSRAMEDCTALVRLADLPTSTLCIAQAQAAAGNLERGYALATTALKGAQANDALRSWGAGIAGEIAARRGDDSAALQWYRTAFELDQVNHYPRVAYADWLLSQDKYDEARQIALTGNSMSDQLRLALAERDPATDTSKRLMLAWNEASARGESGHLRDLGRYQLLVLRDGRAAHATARQNFAARREPEDVMLLAMTSAAVADRDAMQRARTWQTEHGYKDVRLERLLTAQQVRR